MWRSTRFGTRPPRRPMNRTRTPRSFRSSRRRRRSDSLKRMRKRTSSSGRRQFSVENAYTVIRFSPRCWAQRPLPSMTMATWRGTRPGSMPEITVRNLAVRGLLDGEGAFHARALVPGNVAVEGVLPCGQLHLLARALARAGLDHEAVHALDAERVADVLGLQRELEHAGGCGDLRRRELVARAVDLDRLDRLALGLDVVVHAVTAATAGERDRTEGDGRGRREGSTHHQFPVWLVPD